MVQNTPLWAVLNIISFMFLGIIKNLNLKNDLPKKIGDRATIGKKIDPVGKEITRCLVMRIDGAICSDAKIGGLKT